MTTPHNHHLHFILDYLKKTIQVSSDGTSECTESKWVLFYFSVDQTANIFGIWERLTKNLKTWKPWTLQRKCGLVVCRIRNRIVLGTQLSQKKSQPSFFSIHFFEDQLEFLRSWGCEHVDSSLLVSIFKINIISIYEQFKKINFQVWPDSLSWKNLHSCKFYSESLRARKLTYVGLSFETRRGTPKQIPVL